MHTHAQLNYHYCLPSFLSFFFLKNSSLIFRGRKKEGEKEMSTGEHNTDQLPSAHTPATHTPGIEPTACVCAPDWKLN